MAKRTMPPQRPGLSESSVGTPREFIIAATRKLGILGFGFDLAAGEHNAICPTFYTQYDDALDPMVSWNYEGWSWLNPPYSKIKPWVEKACDEATNGAHIAVLVPASVGSNWWKKHVDKQARVLMLNGRITFVRHAAGYPKDLALLLYGPNELPGYESWSWMAELTDEEREMAKKRIGKTAKKPKAKVFKATTKAGKKAEKIAAARASKVTDIKTRKKRGEKAAEIPASVSGIDDRRVTTFKPNRSTSQGMPSLSEFDPGKIELPTPEESQKVLGELASLNDQGLKAKSRYEELKGYTKAAKERYDGIMESLGARLKQATHASDLPLFSNLEMREEAQKVMEAGLVAISGDDPALAAEPLAGEPTAPPVSEPAPEGVETDPPVADVPADAEPLGEIDPLEIPF